MEGSDNFHAADALPPGGKPPYPLNTGLYGDQSRSGSCGEEKNLTLPGIKPGPTEPSRLLHILV
jgi:hypothetical protein